MKFAICNEMFEGWDWQRVCQFAVETGYRGLEVAPFTMAPRADLITPQQRAAARSAAAQAGIEIIGLHWLLVGPQGLHLTHPDADVRRDTAAYFRDLIDLCADLGGKVMVIGSPKQRNLQPGVTREQGMAFAREVFDACVELAGQRGVTLALEPLGPKETNFIQTAQEAIELIERVGHPALRLNLDVKAMSEEAKPIPQIIHASAPYLAHVQVNDPNLLGPGMGAVAYEPIIAALREVGYDEWLSVEAFDMRPGAEVIARQSVEYLRRVTG
jgi:sugar phosphate isomerase/epimerase